MGELNEKNNEIHKRLSKLELIIKEQIQEAPENTN
jgi:hypothetical protein